MQNISALEKQSCLLVTDKFNRQYFSGIEIEEGFVLVTNSKVSYFADARYFSMLKQKAKNAQVNVLLFTSIQSIKRELCDNGVKTLYIDYSNTTLSQYQEYKTLGVDIRNGESIINSLRSVKTKREIENIKKACQIITQAVEQTIPYIKVGVTEKAVRNRLVRAIKKLGGKEESFSSIVAFGKNSAIPHHETGGTRLKNNSAVLIDTGCVYNGYCSDITRTFFVGEPSEKFIKAFDMVASANKKCRYAVKEGAKSCEVDNVAREHFASFNQEQYFTHSLGHGVGLQIHEQPFLSRKGEMTLKNGMAFTIEPGLYYDGEFGIRIEDTVLLEENGAQSLTNDGWTLQILKG